LSPSCKLVADVFRPYLFVVRSAKKAPAKKSVPKFKEPELDEEGNKKKKKRTKKRVETYSTYIYKVLKQVSRVVVASE
jgi:hypothetical protein